MELLASIRARNREIEAAKLGAPEDGHLLGYFSRHLDQVVPTCWLTDEIAPSIERAISVYDSRYTVPSLERRIPTSVAPKP